MSRAVRPYASWSSDAINRPIPSWYWEVHDGRFYACVGMSWGNGNSDPVWDVGAVIDVRLPRWLARRFDS